MYLERYRLEHNPFAPDGVRPVFESRTAQFVTRRMEELLSGAVHRLFVSGPAGAGKSTQVGRALSERTPLDVCWIRPGLPTREALLSRLLTDLGPGPVDGSTSELRNILEVYLGHQVAKGECAVIVADGLERQSVPVLREIESLAQLHYRYRPLVQLVMITRNEDLVSNLIPRTEGARYARTVHQRQTGFSLDETYGYLHACLQSAGCDWPDDLFPSEIVTDIQAHTRGIVGDINTLCHALLEALASVQQAGGVPRLSRDIVREVGDRLHLRYDPNAWRHAEGTPAPGSVRLRNLDPDAMSPARLIVTSGGRMVSEVDLGRSRMVLGRDPACDISLDSSYVSRYQCLLMEAAEGWVLIDFNSTNGCFVNGRRVREHRLHDGDLIAVGQHQLQFVCSGRARNTRKKDDAICVENGDGSASAVDDTLRSPAQAVGRRA